MTELKQILKNVGIIISLIIIGIIIGLLINLPSCNKTEVKEVCVPVHDTIIVTKTEIKEKTIVKYKSLLDTFYVHNSDTVFVELPIEYKEYNDTIKNDSSTTELKINFSGFNAEIDSVYIKHNYFNKQETIIKKPKKFGLDVVVGPYIGYGVNFNNGINSGVQVGIGVTVGLGWRIK